MFIPEMTCSLTVSNLLGRISLINLDYCLLLKYANDRLELLISVYICEATEIVSNREMSTEHLGEHLGVG